MDDHAADVVRVAEAEVQPRLAAVERLVHAVAPRGGLAVVGLARAHVDDRGVGGRDGDVPDRRDVLVVEDGLEGHAVVDRLPEAPRGRRHVEGRRPSLHHREVVDAAAHDGGADAPELQALEDVRGKAGRRRRSGGRLGGPRGRGVAGGSDRHRDRDDEGAGRAREHRVSPSDVPRGRRGWAAEGEAIRAAPASQGGGRSPAPAWDAVSAPPGRLRAGGRHGPGSVRP